MKAPNVFMLDNGLHPSMFLDLTCAYTIIPFVRENGVILSYEIETRQLGV
jgi:hypothetical protein